MINNEIKIEIEMKDSTSMFAIKQIIGYKSMHRNNFTVGLTLEDDNDENSRTSLIFNCTLEGFESVARIVSSINDLNLGKIEEVKTEED